MYTVILIGWYIYGVLFTFYSISYECVCMSDDKIYIQKIIVKIIYIDIKRMLCEFYTV